jgi:hypothetical protein
MTRVILHRKGSSNLKLFVKGEGKGEKPGILEIPGFWKLAIFTTQTEPLYIADLIEMKYNSS